MDLHYKEIGQGHPLIILHGLLGSLDNWQTLAREFGKHFRVITVDQRNHGKSPHHDEMTYELMAGDLLQLMDKLGIQTAHILGHSMGGKTAMAFALRYPERVDKMVVVDIAPRQYSRGHDQIFKALFSLDLQSIQSRSEAEDKLAVYIHEPGILFFLLKNLVRDQQGSFSWKMNLEAIYHNYDNVIEEIEGEHPYNKPVLFIKGGKSAYIENQDMSRIRQVFPAASLFTIPLAGHWVHAEAPEQLYNRVVSFLLD